LKSGNPRRGAALSLPTRPRRKPGRKSAALLLVVTTALLHAELQEWVQHLPTGDWLKVFINDTALRRPPAETRPALTQLITANPKEAALYKLRAQEAELQLDFPAAEADWRTYVQLSSNNATAWNQLAEYFDRRHQPAQQVDALRIAGRAGDAAAFVHALRVISEQGLPNSSVIAIYRAWIQRFPDDAGVRQQFIAFLTSRDLAAAANEQLAAYKKAFADDTAYPIRAAAGLAPDPIAVYDQQFQPLWPDDLVKSYLQLLDESSQLRAMVARSRARLEQNPDDIREAGRLFLYWRQQNNLIAARRVLDEYKLSKQSRKVAWKPDELLTLARLYEKLPDVPEAAELWYTLYSLPGADAYYAETALSALAGLLMTSPEQPIRYGSADLSFYKDIATLDRSPGFLNGILSLILNGTGPRWEYAKENTASTAYFHRAAAADLVDVLDRRFPRSTNRASLHAQLIQAYNTYGDDDAVIRAGRAYLAGFPKDGGRVDVALTIADALARHKREREEFVLYDQMLAELGKGTATNSPPYVRVLDRYLARLSAVRQPLDAVRLYRHEIDRHPDDPGLYERLAAFLAQNDMAADTEAIYRQAMARFKDTGWYDKLARWYLRREQAGEAANLTHQLVSIFSGVEVERYFAAIVTPKNLGAAVYRQLNLYAHERFPEDLVFVDNLLAAYSTEATRDDAAAMALLRQYWFYDPRLRNRFFEALSTSGQLDQELAALRAPNNLAAQQLLAEGEAWRSHFETAAPAFKTTAEAFPGDRTLTSRASSIYRSLATLDDKNTPTAVALARLESRSDPRDREILAKIGDTYADHDRLAAARPFWDAMPATAPGTVEAWRDAATVFWDYYLYDDALRVIHTARARKDDPALLAYEAGAIYEGKRQEDRAVAEYVAGYLDGDGQSEARILKLARRPALRNVVDRLTAEAANKPDADWDAVSLRLQVLRQQQRNPETSTLLLAKIAATRSADLLRKIEVAAATDLPDVKQRALEREIAVTQDPVEQARLRIALAQCFEARKELPAAARTIDALYRERPQILGVVRATVDYYSRNQQPAEAIRILTTSATHSNDQYRDQFTLEAGRLATTARNFPQAREILQPLLARNPYNSEYLAAMAATYLQAGDDAAFRDFVVAAIKALRTSSLPPAARVSRISALRRDLIPALTRLHDDQGAVDQYIEIIDAYPEDDSLIREASLYAARHNLGSRLTALYSKTIVDAPRDYRWPMVLARIQTALEEFPSAISAYDAALKARPDRKDLVIEREALEERLMQFDRAISSCRTLYDLTYHDPQWMLRSATLKARQGKRAEAVQDLQTAVIGESKPTPEALMTVARQLDQWNYIAEAATFAGRAAKSAPKDFDFTLWARIMVRAHHLDEVLAQPAKLPEGPLQAAGQVIRDYYTPDEKASAETPIRKTAIPQQLVLVRAAELTQLEADLLTAGLAHGKPDDQAERALINLQTHRAKFVELAQAMEAYAQRNVADPQTAFRAWSEAETAWRNAGDRNAELRVLAELDHHRALTAGNLERYLTLLNPSNRNQIVALARNSNPAVAFALHTGDYAFTRQAIQARGAAFMPLWASAFTALAGVYDDVHTAEVNAAFQSTLGGGTIGERIRHHADIKLQAVGNLWFYYGARYGEYLDGASAPNAAAYLPATVEEMPGNPEAYFELGSYYDEREKSAQAIEQYQNVLQLDADRGDAENAIARVLWRQNKPDDAITHWRAAIAAFYRVENRGVRVPENFWSGVTSSIEAIGREKQLATLQPDIDKLLRAYVNINGAYRTYDLLISAVRASFDSGVDYGWVFSIGADNEWLPDELLDGISREFHLTPDQQEELARRRIQVAERHATDAASYRFDYINLLLDHDKPRDAQQAFAALSDNQREQFPARVIELKLAAMNGTLRALLESYRTHPVMGLGIEDCSRVAEFLRQHSHAEAARTILEFYYQHELESQHLESANFLGLAGVYLESGDTARAVQILRRMNLISGDEFDTFVPAATLLTERGKNAEAIPFLRDRVTAVPWDNDARLQLARLLNGDERTQAVTRIVQNADAIYAVRTSAARLAENPSADGTTELGLLERGKITPSEAQKPFYVDAREAAGLFREALALRPSDENIRLEALRQALAAKQDAAAIAIVPGEREQSLPAAIILDLSKAYEREGNFGQAIRLTQMAIDKGLDLEARKAQLEAEQQRLAENARRAPTIKDTIEQDHAVKPRLKGKSS
jgi:thioredoxin-like negative regulator of GroEL